ncbi:hypothetical protein MUY34_03955 [Flavihalobacter algicola]|uniref:Uncharacterized protein n=2 Tax=Psychroserpens algicola TaxID=1719034 RepID=A0ABT0H5U3_9FLAO|nr:hypothetical protein [Psychroserpens algicola]
MEEHNTYDIDLLYIYEHERELYLENETSEEFAKTVIDEIEKIIFFKGTASYGIKGFKEMNNKEYHERQVKTYEGFKNDTKQRYLNEYFIIKDSCFQYNQSIIIDSSNQEFGFWFALNIRQYESKSFSIINFLNIQLKKNFKNDAKEFISFLKFGILKDQSHLLNKVEVDTLGDWINSHENQRQVSNKTERKMKGEINSFLLKSLESNPDYFKRVQNRELFYKVYSKLKEGKFIASNTPFDDFIAIFSNKKISKRNRIIWKGRYVELQWFVKYLVYHLKKVVDLKNDIWNITVKCFVNKEGKEFYNKQLSDAKGKPYQRKALLEEILSLI